MSKKKDPVYIDVVFHLENGKKKSFHLPSGNPFFFSKAALFLVESLVMCRLTSVFVLYTFKKGDRLVTYDTEDRFVGAFLQKWEDDNTLPFE